MDSSSKAWVSFYRFARDPDEFLSLLLLFSSFLSEYQFVFVVDEPKRKITLIKEYVDSLYMARWNRKQTEAEKAKGML